MSDCERDTKDRAISRESCKIQEDPPRPSVLDHRQGDNEGENDAVWRER